MFLAYYIWNKEIYFSNKTSLFTFVKKKKSKFLTTNSLTHQDGDCVIEYKMPRRWGKVKALCNFTTEATLCNCSPTALHR